MSAWKDSKDRLDRKQHHDITYFPPVSFFGVKEEALCKLQDRHDASHVFSAAAPATFQEPFRRVCVTSLLNCCSCVCTPSSSPCLMHWIIPSKSKSILSADTHTHTNNLSGSFKERRLFIINDIKPKHTQPSPTKLQW